MELSKSTSTIYNHLKVTGSISQREALVEYSTGSLSKEISRLREAGVAIQTVTKTHPFFGSLLRMLVSNMKMGNTGRDEFKAAYRPALSFKRKSLRNQKTSTELNFSACLEPKSHHPYQLLGQSSSCFFC